MTSMSPRDFAYPHPDVIQDPYAFYAAMRQAEPVYREPQTGIYFVSRYEDATFVAQHPELFSSRRRGVMASNDPEVAAIRAQGYPESISVTASDPPDHRRFRALVNRVFAPKRLLALEPKIRALAHHLVDQFIEAGEADLAAQFASPLPLTVIADLLDLDRADVPDMKKWSDDWVAQLGSMSSPLPRERMIECAHSVIKMQQYFSKALHDREKSPGDDLISLLIEVNNAADEPINHEEMVDMLRVFIVGGNDTTINAIGTLTYRLLVDPSNWARILAEPKLISTVLEEGLRLESPTQWNLRVVTQDVELGGIILPKGAVVCMLWGSANRDEGKFGPDASHFDVGRRPTPHLAFGTGTHFCAGAPLARLELKIALETFAERLHNLRLDGDDAAVFANHPILRGMKQLKVRFDPGPRRDG